MKEVFRGYLINNSNFPIVDYVIGKIAEKFALWTDKELIKGTTDKIEGLSGITQVVTTAASTVITADGLIDAQDMVPDVFQPNCVWIMSKQARTAIRKLKDGEGNYLLNKDATTKWGYTLFGRPVYISDAVDSIAAGNTLSTTAISPDFFYQAFQCVLRTQCRKRIKTADLIKRI